VLTVVDLGVGNIGSLSSALRFLGIPFLVTSEPDAVAAGSALILPGVGSFDAAVHRIDELELREALDRSIQVGVPLLGVCLGMQLLAEASDEGAGRGLGAVEGRCERLGKQAVTKVPHVGFDTVGFQERSWLGESLGGSGDYYFTHSFALRGDPAPGDGTCEYDGGFIAVVERWPVVGVQFHPEKSQTSGLALLKAFLVRALGGS
jgi:glutamine amidotransferase